MRAFSRCSGAISRGGHEWVVLRNGTRGCNTPGLCHVATTRHSCYNTQPQAAAAAAPEAALASTAAGHADDADEEASGSGIKKRVCALHLGYIGTGFKGSQVCLYVAASVWNVHKTSFRLDRRSAGTVNQIHFFYKLCCPN